MHPDNRRSSAVCHESVSKREGTCRPGKQNGCKSTRRKSTRLRANGIVALTCFEQLVVSNIYDIAEGGVSFLQASENEISKSQFEMDILIYDGFTGFEYLISHIRGRVKWKGLVLDPEIDKPIWRFNVEFTDLDDSQRYKLQRLCSLQNQQLFGASTSVCKRYQTLPEKIAVWSPLEGRNSRQPK